MRFAVISLQKGLPIYLFHAEKSATKALATELFYLVNSYNRDETKIDFNKTINRYFYFNFTDDNYYIFVLDYFAKTLFQFIDYLGQRKCQIYVKPKFSKDYYVMSEIAHNILFCHSPYTWGIRETTLNI